MYFGAVALCLGFSLLTASLGRLFWTVMLWLVLEAKADNEEAFMLKAYPGYKEYLATTPKFIPFVTAVFGKGEEASEYDGEQPSFVHNDVNAIAE